MLRSADGPVQSHIPHMGTGTGVRAGLNTCMFEKFVGRVSWKEMGDGALYIKNVFFKY